MSYLIDSFNRTHNYLRISVTDRCNFRCIYCIPPDGIELKEKSEILTFDEIFRLAKIFSTLGVNKIRITGGEPLMRTEIEKLIRRISDIRAIKTIGLTTNGYYLKDKISSLKAAGLSTLNISLDTLRPDRFKIITGQNGLNNVIDGINTAIDVGFLALKLNVVIIRGLNDDEILDFVEFVKDKPLNVRFIEYMPFKNSLWKKDGFLSYTEMMSVISSYHKLKAKNVESVSKDYTIDGYKGTIGFISSISEHLCGTCNRLRLTADGFIKYCLFYPTEVNLRSALRNNSTDETIAAIILSAIKTKPSVHPETKKLLTIEDISMVQIGG